MDDNSWLLLRDQDTAYRLPQDLAQQDAFGARDCGWVEQMRPFVRQFCLPGQTVLDPFCGFGTTLVAAHLEGRRGIGFEIEPARVQIANQRLGRLNAAQQTVLCGSPTALPQELTGKVDLVLTNLPYFGCGWPASDTDALAASQLYRAETYAGFLEQLRQALVALKALLRDDGYLIVMAQNLRLGRHAIPFAWDVARMLAERFVLLEERILLYERERHPPEALSAQTNRAHEYALIARKQAKPIDLDDTLLCLKALAADCPQFIVYGSFARWMTNPQSARLPSDADLLVPDDPAIVQAMLQWFAAQGFRATRWGAPLTVEAAPAAMADAHYFRVERLRKDGRLCIIDLCFDDSRFCYRNAIGQAVVVAELMILY